MAPSRDAPVYMEQKSNRPSNSGLHHVNKEEGGGGEGEVEHFGMKDGKEGGKED